MNRDSHSLGQKVFQTIRKDILSGTYKKGEELKEKAIGESMGVSRTPVREALRQLELEGLVDMIPNKGAYVIGFSGQDMQDIYEIRSALEGLCVRKAALEATGGQIEMMEEILCLTEFHMNKGHIEYMVELDSRFHEVLYEAGGSRVLEHALKDYHYYLEQARRASFTCFGRAAQANQEHRNILEAMKEQNAEKAERAANLHVSNTIKNITSYGWNNIETGGYENGKN